MSETHDPIESAMAQIEQFYRTDGRNRPWVIGFSGGKDSSAVVQLVYRVLRDRIPPDERTRQVHIVASDTLVEAPTIGQYLDDTLAAIREGVARDKLPVTVAKVTPQWEDTYFVLVIGKGYPAPNRFFRWCTERLKIDPTTAYIQQQINKNGSAIILLGARKDESSTRAQAMEHYSIEGSFLRKHINLPNAYIYTPIADWTTEHVWSFLQMSGAPWGGEGNYRLRILYKNAAGGECPLVIDTTTPSCGSSRFGCWTCTVVNADSSMEGFIETGMTEMEPLLKMRNWLKEIRDDLSKREPRGRNGGDHAGPFTLETRKEILERLLQVQKETGYTLIRKQELDLIQQYWVEDGMDAREAPRIFKSVYGGAPLVSTDKARMQEQAEQMLADVCTDLGVDVKLVHQLVHLEEGLQTKVRRRGLMQAIDSVFERPISRGEDA